MQWLQLLQLFGQSNGNNQGDSSMGFGDNSANTAQTGPLIYTGAPVTSGPINFGSHGAAAVVSQSVPWLVVGVVVLLVLARRK